jgi:hypothetical protein
MRMSIMPMKYLSPAAHASQRRAPECPQSGGMLQGDQDAGQERGIWREGWREGEIEWGSEKVSGKRERWGEREHPRTRNCTNCV